MKERPIQEIGLLKVIKEFVPLLEASHLNPNTLIHFPESLKKTRFLWTQAFAKVQCDPLFQWESEFKYFLLLSQLGSYVAYFPQKLENNLAFFSLVVDCNGCAISYASRDLRENRDLAFKAVSRNGMALRYLRSFQDDEAIVKKAIELHPRAIMYASSRLKNVFAFEIVSRFGYALEYLNSFDKALVLKAVSSCGQALQFACEALQDDEEVVAIAIRQDPHAIAYASDRLKKEFAKHVVSLDPMTLKYILDADKELTLLAVEKKGLALKVARYQWRSDKEVVWAAYNENPKAITYASRYLRETLDAEEKIGSFLKEIPETRSAGTISFMGSISTQPLLCASQESLCEEFLRTGM